MTHTALCAMLAVHLQVFIGSFRGRAGSKVNLKADRQPPGSLQSSLHSNQTAWEASEGPASAAPGSTADNAEAWLGPQLDARLLKEMHMELTGACISSSVRVPFLDGLTPTLQASSTQTKRCSDRSLAVYK